MTDSATTIAELRPPLGTRIARGAAASLAFNILSNLFLFIGQLIIPRLLSREEYAQFTVSISFVALMALVADLGMNSMFTRLFTEAEEDATTGQPDRRGTLLGSALVLRLGLALVVALLVIIVAPQIYPANIVGNIAIVLPTILISSRLLVVRAVGESILKSRGKFYLVAAFALADAIAFALALVLGSRGQLSVAEVLWIYSLSNLPGFFFLVIVITRWCRSEDISLRVELRTIRTFVRNALPLSLAIAFLTVHTEIDKLLLYRLSTLYEVSSFGAMVRLISAVIPIPLVLGYVAAPELTRLLLRGDLAKSKQLTELVLRILLVASGAFAIFLMAASTDVAALFLGSKYAASGHLLVFMGWMLLPVFVSTFLTEMSIAAGRFWPFTAYAATLMVAVILGDVLLIPSYGASGAMISKLIAVTIGCAGLLFFLRNVEFLNLHALLLIVLRVAGAICLAVLVQKVLVYYPFPPWGSAAFLLLVFVAAVHFLRILSFSEVRRLLNRLRTTTIS